MIVLDTLTSKERATLAVAAGGRRQGYSYIYENMTESSNRQLGIWPFVLADWMVESTTFAHSSRAERDIIFAEAISGCRFQGGILPQERKRWHISHTEFPEMFNHMKRYTPGEILVPRN